MASVAREREDPKRFEALHDHYFEVATLLLKAAPDDIPGAEHVRGLVEDLWALRSTKVREAVTSLLEKSPAIQANNMSRMEVNVWRHTLTVSMDHFHALSTPPDLPISSDPHSSPPSF